MDPNAAGPGTADQAMHNLLEEHIELVSARRELKAAGRAASAGGG